MSGRRTIRVTNYLHRVFGFARANQDLESVTFLDRGGVNGN